MWNDAVDLFVSYMGNGIIIGWYVVSLVYLFLKEKDSAKRIMFLYFPAVLLLFYFNPLFVRLVYGFIGEEIYYRLLWLLPMSVTIAYVIVCIYTSLCGKKQLSFLAVCMVGILLSGKCIYTNPHFSVAENRYHVPQAVVEICDAIRVEGREVTAAFPVELVQYVRQYDATICMPYGREVLVSQWGTGHPLLDLLSQREISAEEFAYLSKDTENGCVWPCNYIIVPQGTVVKGDLEEYGIVLYDTIAGYDVYHDTSFYIGL